ncbi:nuclear transport factor 2 family protein [Rhodanobacter lindaniclasticus]
MPRHACWVLLLAIVPCAAALAAAPGPDRAACEVWQRELAFARSVQRHDAAAFAAFLADDSVFDANTDKPVRGPQAIVRHWATILAGKAVRLDWYPQHVVASADGTLANSSGPYLFENTAASAASRYTVGQFSTTWRRAADGAWRVAFDGGDSGRPASDKEAAAFRRGRRQACPRPAAAALPTIRH